MPDVTGSILAINGKRGRAPGGVILKVEGEDPQEFSTFDSPLLRNLVGCEGMTATLTYVDKPGKEGKVYRNLVHIITEKAPEGLPEVPSEAIATVAIPPPLVPVEVSPRGLQQTHTLSLEEELDAQVKFTLKSREVIVNMLKGQMQAGLHYDTGKTFGREGRKVLLQPGAYLIYQMLGCETRLRILEGPPQAPKGPNDQYTIVVECEVYTIRGRRLGAGIGSATSLIWSGTRNAYVGRAIDPDKTHNSTLKMAIKRAEVAACRKTTPAHEVFGEDVDEHGYGVPPPILEGKKKK